MTNTVFRGFRTGYFTYMSLELYRYSNMLSVLLYKSGHAWRGWLRLCAASREVSPLSPEGVI